MARARYIIIIEDETGGTSVYSVGSDAERARKLARQVRDLSGRYGAEDGPDWDVSLDRVEPWPGIQAIRRGLKEDY